MRSFPAGSLWRKALWLGGIDGVRWPLTIDGSRIGPRARHQQVNLAGPKPSGELVLTLVDR